jgi:hypothetical protein
MTMMLILLFAVAAVNGVSMSGTIMTGEYPACDGSQRAILECFKFMFDANHDDMVTFDELDQRFAAGNITGVPSPFLDTQHIKNCDIDGDGNLTMADWDSPNRTCLAHPGSTIIACTVCTANGFVMTPPDYFVQPNKRSVLVEGEDHQVRFSKKQLDDHAAKDHTHAKEFKLAAVERLERHQEMMNRFRALTKWKQKQLKEESLKAHLELTEKHIANKKKRLFGL